MLRHCCVSLSGRRKCHFFSTAKDQAWERSAKLVKDTESTKHQPYMQTIRATHDPAMHVKTLEEELMGTMGAALGKQAEKIEHFLNLMSAELVKYNELRQETNPCLAKLKDTALRHNEFREDAKRARWELLVHRQAVGFIVNNHNVVHETYPIGEALPLDPNEPPMIKEEFNKYGDQKDWWERIGRWK